MPGSQEGTRWRIRHDIGMQHLLHAGLAFIAAAAIIVGKVYLKNSSSSPALQYAAMLPAIDYGTSLLVLALCGVILFKGLWAAYHLGIARDRRARFENSH